MTHLLSSNLESEIKTKKFLESKTMGITNYSYAQHTTSMILLNYSCINNILLLAM